MNQATLVALGILLAVLLPSAAALLIVLLVELRAMRRRLDALEARATRVEPATIVQSAPSIAQQPAPTPPVEAPLAQARPTPERGAPMEAARAPTSAPPAPRVTPSPRPPDVAKTKPSLERLIGVKGAAIAGGVVLAIAGMYLVQYSIQQGLLSPAVRISMGIAAGVLCIAGSSFVRRRGYVPVANALGGGGAVVLFAAFWAAHTLYGLWPFWLSFAAMASVTAWCCFASARYSSQTIALLGLLGGFATPIALSSGADRPVGLFTYVLLLDIAFLYVAHKRRWPFLALAGILCTSGMQALWIFARMRPEWAPFGLLILGVSALLFTAFFALQPSNDRGRWIAAQAAGVLLPFALASRFVSQSSVGLGDRVYPIALLAAVLAGAACWTARRQRFPGIALAAALAAACLIWFWAHQATYTGRLLAWELSISSVALALVFHVACEWKRASDPTARELNIPAAVSALGLFSSNVLAAADWSGTIGLWPWLSAWIALTLVIARQAAISERHWLPFVSASMAGLGLCMWCWRVSMVIVDSVSREQLRTLPRSGVLVLVVAGTTAVFWLAAHLVREERARRNAWRASSLFPLLAFITIAAVPRLTRGEPWTTLGVPSCLGLLAAIGALRARSGVWLSVALVLTAHAQMVAEGEALSAGIHGYPQALFAPLMVTAAVFTFLPIATREIAERTAGTWRCSALTAPLWFLLVHLAMRNVESWALPGGVALSLCALPALSFWVVTKRGAHAPAIPALDVARVGYAASALGLLALVLPLHVEHDWALVGASLIAVVWARLRQRHERAWLGVAAVALIVIATLGLCLDRVEVRIQPYDTALWNSMLWTFLVPALAALDVARSLARSGDDVGRFLEPAATAKRRNVGAAACALCAIVLVFAWLNLVILNAFGSAPCFAWPSERVPTRDLSLSLAWALYAILLLVIGLKRASTALRWVSLALFLLTIAKVFLFDLGELQGLYRVGSLAGLAVSLFFVSVLYQRFVFRQGDART